MNLLKRVQDVIKTAVSDLFGEGGEETETADSLSLPIHQTQTRLNELRDQLAQAIAREKRAETAWRTAQAQNNPQMEELERHHQLFVRVSASLQMEIDALQAQLIDIRSQTGQLTEREASAVALERLQQLRIEINKTADSLHSTLQDRTEQVALREDKTAAREEIEEVKRRLQMK